MGLENGVVIRNLNKDSKFYKSLNPDCFLVKRIEEDETPYICYWRKHRGIRNEICYNVLNTIDPEEEWTKLTVGDVEKIARIIHSFTNKKFYENFNNDIWSYEEVHDILVDDLMALTWLIEYMKENSDAEVYFLDSY